MSGMSIPNEKHMDLREFLIEKLELREVFVNKVIMELRSKRSRNSPREGGLRGKIVPRKVPHLGNPKSDVTKADTEMSYML